MATKKKKIEAPAPAPAVPAWETLVDAIGGESVTLGTEIASPPISQS